MRLLNSSAVGLELEYEGVDAALSGKLLEVLGGNDYWTAHRDGSLRPRDCNTEFTFAGPLRDEVVITALDRIKEVLAQLHYTVSWRCGMHVHVDHSHNPEDRKLIARQVVLACLIDRLWFAWDNSGRQESKFCVPISQVWQDLICSPRELAEVKKVRKEWRIGPHVLFKGYKYLGVNTTRALPPDIGTVEYRYGASTKDTKRMLEFILLALSCKEVVTRFPDSMSIVESFAMCNSYTKWINKYMHEEVQQQWCSAVPSIVGASYPTPLEFEAAVNLSALV